MAVDSNDLAQLQKRKQVYEQALVEVKATLEKVQNELQDSFPLSSLVRSVRDLELLIMGCESKIKRIETKSLK